MNYHHYQSKATMLSKSISNASNSQSRFTRSLTLVTLAALIFASCSPGEFFQRMSGASDTQTATSNEQSDVMRVKLERIEAKKRSFPHHVQLEPSEANEAIVAAAFRNDYQLDNRTLIDIEALLPEAQNKFYEVWLSDDEGHTLSIGVLEYKAQNDYILSFETNEDLSAYTAIVITDEAVADDQPETRILSGTFLDP